MGVAVVWWSTHRIAAREVLGSNPAPGILFQRKFNWQILPLRRELSGRKIDQLDGRALAAK